MRAPPRSKAIVKNLFQAAPAVPPAAARARPFLPHGYVYLLALPLTIHLVAEVFLAFLAQHYSFIEVRVPNPEITTRLVYEELTLRTALVTYLVLLTVVSAFLLIATTVRAVQFISDAELQPNEQRSLMMSGAVGFGLLTLYGIAMLLLSGLDVIPGIFDVVGHNVYYPARDFSPGIGSPVKTELFQAARKTAALLALLSVCVQFSFICMVLNMPNTGSVPNKVAAWRAKYHNIELASYASIANLVFALLYTRSWLKWPTYIFADEAKFPKDSPIVTGYASITDSYLFYFGALYTAMSALFLIAAHAALERQAHEITRESLAARTATAEKTQTAAADFETERKSLGLAESLGGKVRAILVSSLPLVAGSFSSVLGAVAEIYAKP